MNKNIFIVLLTLLMLLVIACQNEQDEQLLKDSPASLCFKLSIPELSVNGRSITSDPTNKTNQWTDWEKAVDGRFFYRLTLFLIDKEDRLVGYRDLSPNNQPTTLTVEFKYDDPQHGSIEKLNSGEYTLMAVANYSAYSANDKTYDGLGGSNGFSSTVQTIFNDFYEEEGIANFTTTYKDGIMDYTIDAGDDYVCPQTPQALTLVKHIQLQPGDNTMVGEMIRTYSRVRIEIENNSATVPLAVNDFKFVNFKAQRYAYLFSLPDNEERNYKFESGRPSLDSDDALAKFQTYIGTNRIPVMDATNTTQTDNKKVLYDAYILESKSDDTYTYNLDVEYVGRKYTSPIPNLSEEAYTEPTEIDSNYENSYYVIQNTRSNKYIYNTLEGKLEQSKLENTSCNRYMWKLEKREEGGYYIKNKYSENYIGYPNGSITSIVGDKDTYFLFTTLNHTNGGFKMQAIKGDTKTYLNDYGGAGNVIGGYSSETDGGSGFKFYEATLETKEAAFKGNVILETIASTGHSNPVTSIKRNDFISAIVTVTYNEKKDEGYFDFVVVPWQTGGGDIEFN